MCALSLSSAPQDVILAVLATMELGDRFTCALVCRAWAKAAAAATRAVSILGGRDIRGLQQWLEKYGSQLQVFSLNKRQGPLQLTRLPCAQLQHLQLGGVYGPKFGVASRVWSDIAAATKLTSVTLEDLNTESTPAEVLSVLARLPDLKRLMLGRVVCAGGYCGLLQRDEDSLMLRQLTQITHLDVHHVQPSALRDIVMLGQLCSLVVRFPHTPDSLFPPPWPWPSISCSEVPGLTALTHLELRGHQDIPPAISQMTALQLLQADKVSLTTLSHLSMLPALTRLRMGIAPGYTPESAPPQLPAMREIDFANFGEAPDCLSMSFFDGCPELQKLELGGFYLRLRADSPGSWVASSTLQHLDIYSCSIIAALGLAGLLVPWQQVFTAPGHMGHLTCLQFACGVPTPPLSLADGDCMVDCCSRLQVLTAVSSEVVPALVRLPHLTHLGLTALDDSQCSSLVQLTGLQEFHVDMAADLTTAGLRQLAGLQQLTIIIFNKINPDIPAPYEFGRLGLFNQVGAALTRASLSTAVEPVLPGSMDVWMLSSHCCQLSPGWILSEIVLM